MFDVIWTDPHVELVGERKLRKEQEAKEKDKKKVENGRQSVSTTSSSSSERGFGFFTTKNRMKGSTTSKAKTSTIVSSQGECVGVKTDRTSVHGVKAVLTNWDDSEVSPKPMGGPFLPVQSPEPEDPYSNSTRDSVLSKWADQAAAATGTFDRISTKDAASETKTETLVQTLGPSSYITRTTEVTISRRTPETDIDQLITEVHISSDGVKTQTPPLPELPENASPVTGEELGSFPSPYACPQTPPPIEYHGNLMLNPTGCQGHDRLGNPDAWKPPHEWDCTPTKKSGTPMMDERLRVSPASLETDNPMFPGLAALQRELRIMEAASPELMLANMKSSMGEASDAMVYKELEMTKKRWMFSGLHQQSGYAQLIEHDNDCPESPTICRRNRMLALYETQASASFLAALHPHTSITHLSPHPISPNLFPNVQPLLVPAVSTSAASRALPPRLYSTVTSLSMPALFPSTEIPPFLRHVSRCLAPGGALHLTIIDPQPVSASMGPKLRQWLFENLLINLEQAFRTTLPSETFPAWLAVGRLRGKGSTIASISVPAVAECHSKPDVRTELRCLVTRMLWQEVWGGFVHASRWWWEEEEIVKECVELDTHWQYSHIVAVKEDR
ncbi:hypothetical protein F5Y19DRAFT_162845 [Xylariaceae sp. FL1651]|nr:hypothetical protein F5Y19DRAFT_162845 [Xylariaceae sp. FL1651]